MKKTIVPLCLIAMLLCACEKDDYVQNKSKDPNATKINKVIYDIMSVYYLWNENMPQYQTVGNKDTEEFFESLLNKPADKWSYVSDDSEAEMAELAGSPYSMGYSPMFVYTDKSKNEICIIVEYVYPGTPADKAGLKRGDIIITINGQTMNKDNYVDLYKLENATFGLGKYDASVEPHSFSLTGETLKVKSEILNVNPSIYDTIFYVNNKPVGYYVFTEFNIGKRCISAIDDVFDKFRGAGVKDLIIDLRYNGGGVVETATHLASAIAPANVANGKNVFFTYIYNATIAEDDDVVKFPVNEHNADIENLYVLCTENTASASELVICGLMPYMNVKLIGTNTHGKYCGMFCFDKSVERKLENWFLCPICFKYANSAGLTDFKDGLKPDYVVKEDVTNMYPFGDINDPMLSTALDVVGGQPLTAKSARLTQDEIVVLGRDKSIVHNNLIVSGILK